MIELIGDGDPWVATTSGERLLFMLLRDHQEWRVLADTLKDARLRIGQRDDNMSCFFVGASVLHLQQWPLRLAHDVRDQVPDRWQSNCVHEHAT